MGLLAGQSATDYWQGQDDVQCSHGEQVASFLMNTFPWG